MTKSNTKTARSSSPSSPPSMKRRVASVIYTDNWHYAIIALVLLDLLLVFVDIVLSLNTACTPPEKEEGGDDPTTTPTATNATLNHLLALAFSLSSGAAAVNKSTESTAAVGCTPNIRPSAGLSTLEDALFWISTSLLIVFAADVLLHLYVEGLRMFKSLVTSFDAVVVYSSLVMVLVFKYTNTGQSGSSAIVALRIWKMIRVMHAMSASIEMSHQRTIRAIKSANEAISAACRRTAQVFIDARSGFLDAVKGVEEVAAVTDQGDGSEETAAHHAMALTMAEAAVAVDAMRAALDVLREDVAAANRQRLERAVRINNMTVEDAERMEREEQEIEEMFRRHVMSLRAARTGAGGVGGGAAALEEDGSGSREVLVGGEKSKGFLVSE
ncbi:hypothetical protein DFJ73DRAFT_960704 [Zopfochytrium polystomum]|nr:hypothetical protein DFJ73DRAFT_960704 [Zopfochytrium polystomum]